MIHYSLSDAESDPCSILVQCSMDGGTTWTTATAGPAATARRG